MGRASVPERGSNAGPTKPRLEFIASRAHNGSVCGVADMPLTGPIPEGRPFFCPHCGALYSVTDSPLPKGDNTTAKCVVARKPWSNGPRRRVEFISSFIDRKMRDHRKRPRPIGKLMPPASTGRGDPARVLRVCDAADRAIDDQVSRSSGGAPPKKLRLSRDR